MESSQIHRCIAQVCSQGSSSVEAGRGAPLGAPLGAHLDQPVGQGLVHGTF